MATYGVNKSFSLSSFCSIKAVLPTLSSCISFLQQMNQRICVVILFFWAVLTIVTPTLILLSESSKRALDCNGKSSEAVNVRRMMGGSQQLTYIKARKALAPAPYSGTGKQPEPDQPASGMELGGASPPVSCHCQKSERNLWFGKKLLDFI